MEEKKRIQITVSKDDYEAIRKLALWYGISWRKMLRAQIQTQADGYRLLRESGEIPPEWDSCILFV